MGWYFTRGADKDALVKEILADWADCGYHKLLDHRLVGKHLWLLVEEQDTKAVTIALYLLEASGSGWGYKPLDESMGPYFYDVPQEWGKRLTEAPNDMAAAWRAKAFRTLPVALPFVEVEIIAARLAKGGRA